MPTFLPLRAGRLVQWAGALAALAMLALLAWLGASIFWRLNTPSTVAPIVAIETDPARAAQAIAARHLFGEPPRLAPGVVKATVLTDIALRGVVAPSREGVLGVAVLAVSGKRPAAVREGEEVAPGVKLKKVLPNGVELERGSQIQSLPLPERGRGQPPKKDAR